MLGVTLVFFLPEIHFLVLFSLDHSKKGQAANREMCYGITTRSNARLFQRLIY